MTKLKMQKRIVNITVSHLIEIIRQLDNILYLRPYIKYIIPSCIRELKLVSVSDALNGAIDVSMDRLAAYMAF